MSPNAQDPSLTQERLAQDFVKFSVEAGVLRTMPANELHALLHGHWKLGLVSAERETLERLRVPPDNESEEAARPLRQHEAGRCFAG